MNQKDAREDSSQSDDSDEGSISQLINSVTPRRQRTISPIPAGLIPDNEDNRSTEQPAIMMPAIEPPLKKIKEFTPLAVRKPSRKKKPRKRILDTPT